MASNPAKPKASSRWGSLLSGAVAGLESRLDNIFAEDEERAARERAEGKVPDDKLARDTEGRRSRAGSGARTPLNVAASDSSRNASRTRANDRLQERLARAVVAQKAASQPPSEPVSRSVTPLPDHTPSSLSAKSTLSVEKPRHSTEHVPVTPAEHVSTPVDSMAAATLLTSALPINPARVSLDSSAPPEDVSHSNATPSEGAAAAPHADSPSTATSAEADARPTQIHVEHVQAEQERQDEMHAYLERIDALQAKLQYLARETVAAAKEANANAKPGSLEQKLAEKDERIALLMEEGRNLSKTEMRHSATIKKLRAKAKEEEKEAAELQKKSSRLERSEAELQHRVRAMEQTEKSTAERLMRLPKLEKDLDNARNELSSSKSTVAALRKELADVERRADAAELSAQNNTSQADSKTIKALQEQLEDLKLEKRLSEDRLNAEVRRITEVAEREKQKSISQESEFKSEVANLESRVEALRVRAEEATSDVVGDSQAKLLRQIETLQTQYSLAAENWRTIESTMTSRIAAIETERDDALKREADTRKRAREVGNKAKRADEELEQATDDVQRLSQELQTRNAEVKDLHARLEAAEKALAEAKSDFDRQRLVMESEFNQKLDEERARSAQLINAAVMNDPGSGGALASRTQSPTSHFRKSPAQDSSVPLHARRNLQRTSSQEQTSLSVERTYPRRPSALLASPVGALRGPATPDMQSLSPGVSRHNSGFSLSQLSGTAGGMPLTPSVHAADMDAEDGFDAYSSPQRTINDMISATTVHTGPSVQLVERMSSSIRRLESEKAAHKDELARLVSQRDESRNEVVTLMREVESKRNAEDKVGKLEAELGQVKQRYEACLEMIGEREEEVEELKGDIFELKRIYRDLAERSMK